MGRRASPFLVMALVLLAPAQALAQAWTPPKGEFSFATTYQFLDASDHLFSDPDHGSRSKDLGTVQSQVLVLDGDFGITDRFALNAAVAFVGSRYLQGGNGKPEGLQDDGSWHSGFQDARIGARYVAFNNGTWLLTPSVYYGFPTTNYATLGHTALGRKLNELRMGLDWGWLLSFSGAPRAYLQGNYSYAFMEDTDDVSLNRSNVLVEFGYFLSRHLTLHVWTDYQNVHGGLDWDRDLDRDHHDFAEIFVGHDRSAAADFWRLGGGVSVPVSDSVDVYANLATTLWGVNTHKARTVTFGMSWGFQIIGSRGLGIWDQRDDANADMDDWLLDGLADGEDKGDGDTSQGDAR